MAEAFFAKKAKGEMTDEHFGRSVCFCDRMRHVTARTAYEEAAAHDKRSMQLRLTIRRLGGLRDILAKRSGAIVLGSKEDRRSRDVWDKARQHGRKLVVSTLWSSANTPGPGVITALLGLVNVELAALQRTTKAKRISAWRANLRENMLKRPGKVFRAVKGDANPQTRFLLRDDGTPTANLREMDGLLHSPDAWGGIFQRYKAGSGRSPPCYEQYKERYRSYFPQGTPCTTPDITADELAATFKKISVSKAAGPDGWQAAELKALPMPILELLASALNEIEASGDWPPAIARAFVALIPKGEGGAPLKQRPITITSIVYRLWAATRLRHIMEWYESWLQNQQHGFRPKRSTQDLFWYLSAKMEKALLHDEMVYGVAFDYAKCFDRIPQEIMFGLLEDLGLPCGIATAMKGMYRDLSRRFKLPAGLGSPFHATNGILQGCPLSIVFLNALVSVWMTVIERDIAAAEALAYADDTYVLTATLDALQLATEKTKEYCDRTDQELNAKKSACYSNDPAAADVPVTIGDTRIPFVKELTSLGTTLFARQAPEKIDGRIEEATRLARRAASVASPLTQAQRTLVCQTLIIPKGTYGIAVQQPDATKMRSLGQAIERCIAGEKSKVRSEVVALALVQKGHLIDPITVMHYQRIMSWAVLSRRPECRDLIVASRGKIRGRREPLGPVSLLASSIDYIGWKWESSTRICDANDSSRFIDSTTMKTAEIGHTSRDLLLQARLRGVKTRRARDKEGRENLAGIHHGVDKGATLALLRTGGPKALKPYDAGILRYIIADGQLTRDRRYRRGMAQADACMNCDEDATEDLNHVWWQCEAWEGIRQQHPSVTAAHSSHGSTWPNCLACLAVRLRRRAAQGTWMPRCSPTCSGCS